ncbi:MAG: histidine phosphotransferase [Alphaproteobacteria bacterium]|nr:histidine phosphotransferase [Alphaproteobacteria bacterium]
MTDFTRLSDLDLSALLCSRVCHDVISPVGAIANGLELMDDPENDQETKVAALDMVRRAANVATAKLKFCRIAFGASGSAGAHIDMGEAGEIAKAFVGDEKIKLEWQVPRENRPKQEVKLLLNMLLLAIEGLPRGGVITAATEGAGFSVRAQGDRAKLKEAMVSVLEGSTDLSNLDARLIQPYYARILGEALDLKLVMAVDGENAILVTAKNAAAAHAAA